MTNKKKQEIKESLIKKGWIADRYGNLKKEKNKKLYRYKFKANVIRFEVKGLSWVRLKSYYYKDIKLKE